MRGVPRRACRRRRDPGESTAGAVCLGLTEGDVGAPVWAHPDARAFGAGDAVQARVPPFVPRAVARAALQLSSVQARRLYPHLELLAWNAVSCLHRGGMG